MMNLHVRIAAAAAALALAPAASLAVDGVILIDQNKALAGNVTAGDAPGFPITINTPGSYRLSGNLTVPVDVHGIVIAADRVTLDLNGFSISGSGLSYSDLYYGLTDAGVSRKQVVIRNGHVSGFAHSVDLRMSNFVTVEHMTLSAENFMDVYLGHSALVRRNLLLKGGLIQTTCPSIVTENILYAGGWIFHAPLNTYGTKTWTCIDYHNRSISGTGQNDPINE